jgi:uncharacterized protein YcbX
VELAEVIGHLALLRRFPVRSLAGETPNEVLVRPPGIAGDRIFDLLDEQTGAPLSSEQTPDLLRYSARFLDDMITGEEAEAWARVRTPEGQELPVSDLSWVSELSRRLGRPLRLRARGGRTDGDAPLQVLTVPTLQFLESVYGGALEPRRLRANFLLDLPDGRSFDEDAWIGKRLRVGEALLEIVGPGRSVITAIETEGRERDLPMLSAALSVRGGSIGVRARTLSGRRARVADPVSMAD